MGMSLKMTSWCPAGLEEVVGQWGQKGLSLRKQTTQGTGESWHSGSEARNQGPSGGLGMEIKKQESQSLLMVDDVR